MATQNDLFQDLLTSLEVRHTPAYSHERFRDMPFKSLFGLKKLLEEYGVESTGVKFHSPDSLRTIPPPFLAQKGCGFVTVTGMYPGAVEYLEDGERKSEPYESFRDSWKGVALLCYPTDDAAEPDYGKHRFTEIAGKAKTALLVFSLAFIFIYLLIRGHLLSNLWNIPIIIFDCCGLYVSYLLLLKQLNIKSAAADKMCGVIQAEGCNTVLSTSASKFFGLFGWSEVGFAYFSVSLISLLLFPDSSPSLAAINICCLPFSIWSVWYQKTRAKAWCTLCLTVQSLLWLLFFSYLCAGDVARIFPLHCNIIVLGFSYLTALLAVNRLLPYFNPLKRK